MPRGMSRTVKIASTIAVLAGVTLLLVFSIPGLVKAGNNVTGSVYTFSAAKSSTIGTPWMVGSDGVASFTAKNVNGANVGQLSVPGDSNMIGFKLFLNTDSTGIKWPVVTLKMQYVSMSGPHADICLTLMGDQGKSADMVIYHYTDTQMIVSVGGWSTIIPAFKANSEVVIQASYSKTACYWTFTDANVLVTSYNMTAVQYYNPVSTDPVNMIWFAAYGTQLWNIHEVDTNWISA
jgi:hypothetical protein